MVTVIPDDTDFSGYVDKEIGETIEEFIDWLRSKVDYPKLDERSVFLALRLYGPFQRSESHQDRLARKARGDSSPPRPAPSRKGGAKPQASGPRGKATPPASKPAPKAAAAKAAPAKATPAKPARGKPSAPATPRGGGKRGAVAPY